MIQTEVSGPGIHGVGSRVLPGDNAESPNPWGGVPTGLGPRSVCTWPYDTDCNLNRPFFPKKGIERVVLKHNRAALLEMETKMARFMVSYDLSKPGRNYEDLYKVLKSFDHVRPLESVWFLWSSLSREAIREKIKAALDPNDHLLVTSITYSAWYNLKPEVGKWLEDHPVTGVAA